MRRAATPLLVAALLVAVPAGVVAQQGNMRLTPSPAMVQFPTPDMTDLLSGYVDADPLVLDMISRPPQAAWEIHLRSDSPDMGVYGKPISDLLWRREGSSTWQPLSSLDALVAEGSGDATVVIHLRLRIDFHHDRPGTYVALLTFTPVRT